jgi:hypothetical protein
MATIDLSILSAAHEDGLFKRRLTANQRGYCHRSVLTASDALDLIDQRGDDGIDLGTLAQGLGIHRNTASIYGRWLRDAGLVAVQTKTSSQGAELIYRKGRAGNP